MHYFLYLVIAIMADVISHYVRKWLDSEKKDD